MNKIIHLLPALLLVVSSAVFSQTPVLTLQWQKTAQVQTIEFSSTSDTIVTGGATGNCYPYQCGQIKTWKTTGGNILKTITTQNMGFTNDVDISKDGKIIISGNGTGYCYPNGGCVADKPGQFKFTSAGGLKKSLANPGGNIYAVSYSPGENFIAAGTGYNNSGDIRIYDKSFSLIRTLPGHESEVDGLVFTQDTKYLISGGDDGLVKFWNYKTGALIRTLTHGTYLDGGSYVNVAVSPDGKYIASAGQGYNMTTKIWRISDGKLIRTLTINGSDGYNTVQFTPDGKFVVSGLIQYGANGVGWYGRILFWNMSNGTLVKDYKDTQGSPQSGGIRTIAFSGLTNNSYYLAYSVAGTLKLFSVTTSQAVVADAPAENINKQVFGTMAFPNPFKTSVTIQYHVSSKQKIALAIYDMQGRKITTLADGIKDEGDYSVTFHAAKLQPGIYLYKIITGNKVETREIILSN